MYKRIFSVFLVTFLFFGLVSGSFAKEGVKDVSIVVDGKQISPDVPPQIVNDRTIVPIRFVAEALGAQVGWDNDTRTVSIKKPGVDIKLVIDGEASNNGVPVQLDVPAILINDRTMVPLRFVSECLGCQVNWDPETRTVEIISLQEQGPVAPGDEDTPESADTENTDADTNNADTSTEVDNPPDVTLKDSDVTTKDGISGINFGVKVVIPDGVTNVKVTKVDDIVINPAKILPSGTFASVPGAYKAGGNVIEFSYDVNGTTKAVTLTK